MNTDFTTTPMNPCFVRVQFVAKIGFVITKIIPSFTH